MFARAFVYLVAVSIAAGSVLSIRTALGAESADLEALKDQYRRPLSIPFPDDRPYSPQIATLGKMLYFDPRLSGAQNMNCASCHNPSFGWETPVETAIGALGAPLSRHAPAVLNLAWVPEFFWDGRAASLEEQAVGPMTAEAEMNGHIPDIVKRLEAIEAYNDAFDRLFPGEGVTRKSIVTAIATYERTVVSAWAPFDRWVEGDETAISESAKRGFELFNGTAKCARCHTGWNFTDNKYHDIGIDTEDIGRAKLEPGNPKALHAFKTPGLRNITHRSPYTHNGSQYDLEAIVVHYMGGGIKRPSLSDEMEPFYVDDDDIDDLVAFLHSLTADESEVPTPILPTN